MQWSRMGRGLEPISLRTELIDPVEHPLQQGLGGGRRYASLLERKNLPPLAPDLCTPALDLGADEVNVWHIHALQLQDSKRTK
jgi:hypothetical protein